MNALDICQKVAQAGRILKCLTAAQKNHILTLVAHQILQDQQDIVQANALDLEYASKAKYSDALIDRLRLDAPRLKALSQSVLDIVALPDPNGSIVGGHRLPNGVQLITKRVPLGVVMCIYESRPNVTIDVASLCFKSGNACILRGGKEAFHTNQALARVFVQCVQDAKIKGLDEFVAYFLQDTSRDLMFEFLKQHACIDAVVPRGGRTLIEAVSAQSQIPVIKHDKGVCNLYIDKDAPKDMAIAIALNAKTSRPGVCNAIENLVLHKDFLHKKALLQALKDAQVALYLDEVLMEQYASLGVRQATDEDFEEEFLSLELGVKTVQSIDEAITFIHRYGSGHSEAIVSNNQEALSYFEQNIEASGVFVNCSTRFNDGGQLGFGAEVGISTGKLHVRGPMGLVHLMTTKHMLYGTGQVRH